MSYFSVEVYAGRKLSLRQVPEFYYVSKNRLVFVNTFIGTGRTKADLLLVSYRQVSKQTCS